MSIKKQEEEVKLLTEVFRMSFTLFLTLSGALGIMLRAYLNKDAASKVGDELILICGGVLDAGLIALIFWIGIKIKGKIKTL